MTLILKSINETDSIFTFEAGDIMDITSKGDEGKPFLNIDFHAYLLLLCFSSSRRLWPAYGWVKYKLKLAATRNLVNKTL